MSVKVFRLVLLAVLALPLFAAGAGAAQPVAPGRVVVAFDRDATATDRRDARAEVDGRVVDTIVPRVQVLDVPRGTVRSAVADLRRDGDVAWAQVDALQTSQWTPDDPSFASQWAWRTIAAPTAWESARGDGVLVGVVDTGVGAGVADFGAMLPGWDFVDGDSVPEDGTGHGTAVGSMINAATNNASGMAGVAPGATLIYARVLDNTGSGYASTIAAGMDYVADQGARIVNVSLGGGKSLAEQQVIEAHPDVLFVVAAGNSTKDNDVPADAMYPCAEPAANVLCVGATTKTDAIASFSNWGATSVDLMAPGAGVHGLTRTGDVSTWNGTSFSSPITAGVAALLGGLSPSATAAQLKAAILSSAAPVASLAGRSVTGGRLDAGAAVAALGSAPPASAPAPAPPAAPAPAPVPAATPAPTPVITPQDRPAATPPASVAPAAGTAKSRLAFRSRTRIAGTPRVGRVLTARPPALRGSARALRFQWSACDRRGRHCVSLRRATGKRFAIPARLAGHRLRLRVTAIGAAGRTTSISALTARVTTRR